MSIITQFSNSHINPWLQLAVNQLFNAQNESLVEVDEPLTGCVSRVSLAPLQSCEAGFRSSFYVVPQNGGIAFCRDAHCRSFGCIDTEYLSEMPVSAIMDEVLFAELMMAEAH